MGLNKLKIYGELVMFSHTLFSLPFAIIAMLWAAGGLPSARIIFWILVALIGARNGANALNRIIDKRIDAANPRTADRHMPQKTVNSFEVIVITVLCFSIFVLAAFMLNPLCVKLLPLAMLLFVIYSFTKRFTWACHIILGIACGGAPLGAWVAVTGELAWPGILLSMVVTLWVAGFDIIYATQDINFDKDYGLFSIPVRFGLKNSLLISAMFHIASVLGLLYLYSIMNMGWIYLIGIFIVTILLIVEHVMVSPKNLKTMKIASYNINQVVSVVVLLFTVADIYLI